MEPGDNWLLMLNFCLIVESAGELIVSDFTDERLYRAWQVESEDSFKALDPVAAELVLEFQRERANTEGKTFSPIPQGDDVGETKELSNGPVSIPLPGVPSYV